MLWVEGELVPLSRAYIPVTDHSFIAGDGAFETIGVVAGTPIGITLHLVRLRRSLSGLGLDLRTADSKLKEAVAEVIDANRQRCDWIRLTVSAGDGPISTERSAQAACRVLVAPGTTAEVDSVSVVTAPWPRNERGALTGLKTTSYAENTLALARARASGASEAIFANTRGELCECAASNIFVVLNSELITPPLTSGCLEGVTRHLVISTCEVTERTLLMADLLDASEAFLTSSVRGAMPITCIDGRDLPIGAFTQSAQDAYAALIKENPDP
ncbi:MAG: aminotransferase class IV [Actinomycetota bacterium]